MHKIINEWLPGESYESGLPHNKSSNGYLEYKNHIVRCVRYYRKYWLYFCPVVDASIPHRFYPLFHFNLWYIVFLIEHSFSAIFGTNMGFILFYSVYTINRFLYLIIFGNRLVDLFNRRNTAFYWKLMLSILYCYETNISIVTQTVMVRRHFTFSVS